VKGTAGLMLTFHLIAKKDGNGIRTGQSCWKKHSLNVQREARGIWVAQKMGPAYLIANIMKTP